MPDRKKKIVVIVEKTDTGFSAFARDYTAYTTGRTMTELQENILDALNLHFEDENRKVEIEDILLEIDLKEFFQYYRVLNAKYLAERIGINATLLSQYVQGRKKPSHKQTEKILEGINEIGRELSELHLIAK